MNKKIAELKGLCWHDGSIKRCPKCKMCQCEGCRPNPDYEHNISDAWPLFEELPSHNKKMLLSIWKNLLIAHIEPDYLTDICEEYIAYKEGK